MDSYRRPLRLVWPLSDRQLIISKLLTVESARPRSIIVCGPKNSGKSTFCRMLLNAMLTRPDANTSDSIPSSTCVAFLDLDPGQPEYSPPGELSLILLRSFNLGPPFTHPMIQSSSGNCLLRAHHIGSVSPRDNPDYYIKCAFNLLDEYRKLLVSHPSCPLIVNTAGWIQGTGLRVLIEIIQTRRISDVVYTSTRGPDEFAVPLTEAAQISDAHMHFLESQESPFTTRTAKDLRQMQTMSYLHLDESEGDNLRWNGTPLMEQFPLTVHWAGRNQGIFAVMQLNDAIDSELLFPLLDGCLVGLVVLEDDTAIPGNEMSSASATPESQATGGYRVSPTDQFALAQIDLPGESESEAESITSSNSSNQRQQQQRQTPNERSTKTLSSDDYITHPSIRRNGMEIPYLVLPEPLDPSKSYSLGQAFVRGMDPGERCFQLLTPIPPEVLRRLHNQRRRIVFVRGRLETPGWAFQEQWQQGAALRQKLKREYPNDAVVFEAEEHRLWAERTPYVSSTNLPRTRNKSTRERAGYRGSDSQDSEYGSDD